MMSWIMERRFCATKAASALTSSPSGFGGGSMQGCVNGLCSPNQTDSPGGVHERQIAVIAAMTAEAALTLPQGIYSSAAVRRFSSLRPRKLQIIHLRSSAAGHPPLAPLLARLLNPLVSSLMEQAWSWQ